MPVWRLAPENAVDFDELNALNLNVFVPLKALKHETKTNPIPVMVWVHGGAFTWGSNADPLYDAVNLVQHSIQLKQPVIVVAINYRVNISGFLASKELQEELEKLPEYPSLSTYDRSIGNWGLMDQKLAFEWVRENIASFGGDAKNITGFGESAGSASLHYHMALPSHHGLFDHAILQSGTMLTLPPEHVQKEGQANFDMLLERLNIPMPGVHYPFYDNGKVFPALSADGVKSYTVQLAARDVDAYDPNLRSVLLGSTKDEGTTFPIFFGECSPQTWPSFLRQLVPLPELHTEAERVYGVPKTDAEAELIFSKLIGDAGFSYSTHVISDTLLSLQSARSVDQFRLLRYNMEVGMEKLDEIQLGLGATHGVELPFVFGAPNLTALLTEGELRLSREMQRLWISFAHQKDYKAKAPSNEIRVPQAENGEAFVMTNTHRIEIGKCNRLTEAQRAFWDRLAQMQLVTTATL
ncbi:unnamed protein product [Mortierella alpina]